MCYERIYLVCIVFPDNVLELHWDPTGPTYTGASALRGESLGFKIPNSNLLSCPAALKFVYFSKLWGVGTPKSNGAKVMWHDDENKFQKYIYSKLLSCSAATVLELFVLFKTMGTQKSYCAMKQRSYSKKKF